MVAVEVEGRVLMLLVSKGGKIILGPSCPSGKEETGPISRGGDL